MFISNNLFGIVHQDTGNSAEICLFSISPFRNAWIVPRSFHYFAFLIPKEFKSFKHRPHLTGSTVSLSKQIKENESVTELC